MKEYYIHPTYARKPKLIVNIDGVLLDLKGKDSVEKIPATAKEPEREVKITGATQNDLKKLAENPEDYGDFSRIIKSRDKVSKTSKNVQTTD